MAERDGSGDHGEEGFLGRWSRLKQEARTAEEPPADVVPAVSLPLEPSGEAEPAERRTEEDAPAMPELPPLDSLDAGSDYTGFLRREVPEELRRQALRKAWSSDPAIAGFRGFAEYDWDFNAPGYGALRPTDDIARLLEAVLPTRPQEGEEDGTVTAEAMAGTAQEAAREEVPDNLPSPAPAPDEEEDRDGMAEAQPSSLPNTPPATPQTQRPPSTSRHTPVRKAASSEHR